MQERVAFFKMSGGGNDFIVIDNRSQDLPDTLPPGFVQRACTRRLSLGADGVIIIVPSKRASFGIRAYNADGLPTGFCANGTRCAARFALLNVIASKRMTIETGAGLVKAEVKPKTVRIQLESREVTADTVRVVLGDRAITGWYSLLGVPHYLTEVTGLWEYRIAELGRTLRRHETFAPEGVNVNFLTRIDAHRVDIRTYERGVEGETLSCGSGCLAAAVTLIQEGKAESPVSFLTRSGILLTVEASRDSTGAWRLALEGDARVICRGALWREATEGFRSLSLSEE